MTVIVDVIFTVVLALTSTEGNQLQQFSAAFPTRAACQSFRGERIDFVNAKTEEEKKGYTFYISECTAVPVAVVK